nr:hypothetical protein CTI12_AA543480 [Tanacetum cinerariifolium]
NDDEYEYTMFSEEEQEVTREEEDNDFISNRYYDQSPTKDDLLADVSREEEEDLFVFQTSA